MSMHKPFSLFYVCVLFLSFSKLLIGSGQARRIGDRQKSRQTLVGLERLGLR